MGKEYVLVDSGCDFKLYVQDIEIVTISTERYKELTETFEFLKCLVDEGVEEWPGYSRALKKFKGE
jgi:hypothetical protein